MFRIALRATLAKKLRLLSTALSVLLGVAFLSGTLVFTDTIRQTFDDLFADIYDETDSYVRSATSFEGTEGEEVRGRIPESVVATVEAVDGVADVQPVVAGFAQVIDTDGEPIGDPEQGAPTFALSYVGGAVSPWQLTEGSRPPGPGELVLDKGTFDKGGFELGDTVTVMTQAGPQEFALVGAARFGSVDSPGGASISILELRTAQDVLVGHRGEVDALMVDAAPGVSEDEVTAAITAALPTGVEALTGSEITAETQDAIGEGLSFFNTFLLVFAAIGLVVACFTIYNTFQIIVTQRTREMALMRAIGASRAQVLWAQLLEAVVIGLLASVAGLFAGVFVAGLLEGMLNAFGIDTPSAGTVFQPRTAVIALSVGLVVTVVSAVFPSLRASRVPPLAALREVALDLRTGNARRGIEGGVLLAGGIGFMGLGLTGGEVLWVGIGALAVFVGTFMIGPLVARPAMRFMGAPLPVARGVVGELAQENASRNPRRTARTGGALMVSVALVVGITIIAATAKEWTRDVFGDQFSGDFVVSTSADGLSPELTAQLNELPEVAAAAGIRGGAAHVSTGTDADGTDTGGKDTGYVAIDPATAGQMFDIGMIEGTIDALTDEGVLVDDDEAAKQGLAVGNTINMAFLNGTSRTLTVEGTYTDDELAGRHVVTHALHEQTGVDQLDGAIFVSIAPDVSEDEARAAIDTVAAPFANAEVQSRSEFIDAQAAQVDQIVNLMYALLALAVVIALFSIANSMSLSIYERTRELGLLRAVGMTRAQTRASVRWESILIALLGSLLGLVVGVFFGWAISVALANEGLAYVTVPFASLAVIVVLAVTGALIASLRPARRAARLDVLRAVATE